MADEIGAAYLSIAPSLRGFKPALEQGIQADLDKVGKAAGQKLGTSVATGVGQSSGALRAAGAKAGGDIATGATAGLQSRKGLFLAASKQFFTSPIQFARDFKVGVGQAIDEVGGKSAAFSLLAKRAGVADGELKTLGTRALSLRAVGQAAQGVGTSLGGVASLVAAGGPLAVGLAAGGLALSAYMQVQEEAKGRVDALTGALDQQSGALTSGAIKTIIDSLNSKVDADTISRAGLAREQVLRAAVVQGQALADVLAEIESKQANVLTGGTPEGQRPAEYAAALQQVKIALQQVSDEAATSHTNLQQQQADTAFQTQLMRELGIATDDTADAGQRQADVVQNQVTAVKDAGTLQQIYAGYLHQTRDGLDGVTDASRRVIKAIEDTPKKVIITAQGVGFEQLQAQIRAAAAALFALAQGRLQQAQSIKSANAGTGLSPGRPGGDVSGDIPFASDDSVADAQRRFDAAQAAIKKARDALKQHNSTARVALRGDADTGGGGSTKDVVDAAAEARKALRKSLKGALVDDLLKATPEQINSAISDLLKNVKAGFSGKQEKNLVDLVKANNAGLQAAASQRARIADSLKTASDNASGIRSDAIGGITDRSWTAKGVKELLRRRLAHIVSFKTDLKTLAKRGLPQEFLNDLIQAGPEAAWKTAHGLATSDATLFASIKSEAQQVIAQSTTLGNLGAGLLAGAGADTAQTYIDGLRSKDSAIRTAMRGMAKLVQDELRQALGLGGGKGGHKKATVTAASVRGATVPKRASLTGVRAAGRGGDIYVDARGSHDPVATELAVVRGIRSVIGAESNA